VGISKEELLTKLNGDLPWEYAALIQYVQHAVSLSDQIDFLGGVPAVEVQTIKVSDDSVEMLEFDLEGELDAIAVTRRGSLRQKRCASMACAAPWRIS
jgi:bacterioferritin